MPRFTRQELLEAHEQMKEEEREELKLAERAAKWLEKKCERRVGVTKPAPYVSDGYRDDVPWLPDCILSIPYNEYDSFNDWLEQQLEPNKKMGISIHEKGFWLNLGSGDGFPEGTRYYCFTSYYDSHGN